MRYVIDQNCADGDIGLAELGGKAATLYALRDFGVSIPEWFAVTPAAYQDSMRQETGRQICERVAQLPNPKVWAEIKAALVARNMLDARLAVRSSALVEDQAGHSFAGQFESRLSVSLPALPEAIAAVWRSNDSARVGAYRQRHELADTAMVPAILIQRMLEPDAAGIAFSIDPVGGRRDICVVAAVAGLGDRLAAGEVSGDTFHVNRENAVVARKLTSVSSCLDDTQVAAVATLARRLEARFGCPQDLEWAFRDGELYLLQSRPITTTERRALDLGATPRLWDNSNIVESYAGIVSPLTFTFARRAYESVYRQFAQLMGVPKRRIDQNTDIFGDMLGLFRGRVYYNLLNWYRLLRLFPGYALNRDFMEQMMGVAGSLPPELAREVSREAGVGRFEKIRDALQLAATLAVMVKKRLRLRKNIEGFHGRIETALGMRSTEISNLSLEDLVKLFHVLEGRLLKGWDAPLINDFFCMIAFGVLGHLLERNCGSKASSLRNRLVARQGGMISAEPLQHIREMAELARGDEALIEALLSGTPETVEQVIATRPTLKRKIEAYLDRFDGRCFEELKLESPTLSENTMPLYHAVGAAAISDVKREQPTKEEGGRLGAELALQFRRQPIRHWVLGLIIAEARARMLDRENLRFERTRVFGRAREIFRTIGERLQDAGYLGDARDVFYLEVDEILGFVAGTTTSARLGELAGLRSSEYESFAQTSAPPSRFLTRGAVHAAEPIPIEPLNDANPCHDGPIRTGTGCSIGTVKGAVRVVRDPHDATILEGEILVAEYTDPGWIMLFSRAAGLIVERGSLLSHSAIVAREMGIPAIVALPGLMAWLEDGDVVEMDGATGRVLRVSSAASVGMAAQ